MADISNEFIKDSFDYVLQSDLSTGVVYRLGGEVPVNPIFQSGLTINSDFTFKNGSEYNGFVLTCDVNGNATWKPVSGTSSGFDTYVTGGTYSAGTLTLKNNTGGTFNVSGFSTNNTTQFTGGTVSGSTIFTNGLTANTISATTYQNLPATPFLPLYGGTVTGKTVFTSGVTANTLNITNYIDFSTGTTNPSAVGGRIFFDNYSKSLSYYDVQGNNLPIAIGQQLFVRVNNATGTQIDKGKVISITGTTNGLPSAILSTNNHSITSARPIGVAAENIPSNSDGLVITNGLLSGITLNTFKNGDTLYLSDTIPGGYVSSTSSLSYTARTNEIGYVIQTGTTTGKIYVTINNEDSNLSLTDIERNILEGNMISTGAYEYTGMTQGTGQTINVAYARGWIVKNTYAFATLPDVTNVYYTGGTNIALTYLTTADSTYILINSGSTLVQQTTFPTPQQRRENIFLGKVVHPNRSTITSINNTVDFDVSPMASLRDLWTPIKLINKGVTVSPHSTTLEINTSAGTLWGNGIGWTTNQLNPDSAYITGQSPVTFQYRSRLGPVTGATAPYTGNTTFIDPAHYDNNGVITSVGGGSNSSTNQRVYLFPTGLVRIQYGQQVYGSLSAAIAGSQTEEFVEYGNNRDNGILIGIISVNKNTTNLSDTGYATFNFVSKFGEIMGGTGGISTTTLQQAYDNSSNPEIIVNSILDGLSIKNGTGNGDSTTRLLEGVNAAGNVTSFITASGVFSGSSIQANISGGTGLLSSQVTTALGYTPYNSTNPNNYISGITSGNVTNALGFTPSGSFVYSYSVWVSPNGNDTTGTLGRIDLPFRTVRGAIEKLKSTGGPNYTIFVMPGSYTEISWSFNSGIENTTIKFCGNVRIVFNSIVGYSSSIVVADTTVSFIGDDRTVSSSINVFNNVSISNNVGFDSDIFEIFGSSFVNISNLSIMPYNNNSTYSNSDILMYDVDGRSPKININNCTLISESDYNITSRYSKFNGSVSINNSYISSVALKYVNEYSFSNISIKLDGSPDSCGYWQITNTNFRMCGGIMTDNHNTHIYMNTISEGVWGRLSGCIFYGIDNGSYFIWRNVVSGYLDIVGTIYSTCGIDFENVNVNFGTAVTGVVMLDPEKFYR